MVGRHVHFERMRLFRILGRRGLLLLMFGVIWVIFGVQAVAVPMFRFHEASNRELPIVGLLDTPVANGLWVVTGLTSIIVAFIRVRRGGYDALGFNALLVMPFLYTMGFLWSGIGWLITNGQYGRESVISACLVWCVVCALLLLTVGWSDADDPAHRRQDVI